MSYKQLCAWLINSLTKQLTDSFFVNISSKNLNSQTVKARLLKSLENIHAERSELQKKQICMGSVNWGRWRCRWALGPSSPVRGLGCLIITSLHSLHRWFGKVRVRWWHRTVAPDKVVAQGNTILGCRVTLQQPVVFSRASSCTTLYPFIIS